MKIKKVYDLTQELYHNCPGWPDFPPPVMVSMLYIGRDGCNVEKFVDINTHTATHIDAPSHWIPDGKTHDQIPVDTWIGEGVVVDMTHKKDKEAITDKDLEKKASHVKSGDIVMIYTGRDIYRGFNEKYLKDWPSIDKSGAEWVVRKNVKIIGTDGLGIEMYGFKEPLVHTTLLKAEIPIIEELYLEEIAKMGQKRWLFICLPLKIRGAGGAFARVIAIDEEK